MVHAFRIVPSVFTYCVHAMKSIRLILFPLLLLSLVFTGCDSSVDEGATMVTLRLQPTVDGTPLSSDLNTSYTVNGTATSFTSARIYLSEITLLGENGEEVPFEGEPLTLPAKDSDDNDISHTVTDRIVLARHDLGMHNYMLGEAPSGSYTGIRYKVGIAGTTNRVDASQAPAEHPLAKQTDRNNHWNWNAGYQFLRIDGKVDTNADGAPDEVWEVHLGTSNFLVDLHLPMDFELHSDEAVDLHMIIDYARLLQDVDLTDPDERLCHTADNLPVANKVGAAIDDAFHFHGVHESNGHDHN